MNSIIRIANTVVNSIATRIASNNSNVNNANICIVKEDTSMNTNNIARSANTVSRIARRSAASLLALGGLLALSHTAKADVEIYRFVPPSQAFQVPAGSTYVQIKAGNTDNFTVSNLQFTIGYQYEMYPGTFAYAYVQSSVFSLNPVGHTGESLWLNIPVPAQAANGLSWYGKTLSADVYLNGKLMQHTSFADVAPAPNVQATGKMTGNTPQQDGSVVNNYLLTFTNNGYADAPAQTVTVQMQRWAEGPDGAPYTVTLSLPKLAVGQSVAVRVNSQATYGKSIRGTVLLNNIVIGTF